MSSTKFPLEIEEAILDLLAIDDKDHSALKSCSLVCSAFLPICRKHIFSFIAINLTTPSQTSHALQRLLLESPGIANYIRKLAFSIVNSDLNNPLNSESFKRISRLKSLYIGPRQTTEILINWSDNPLRSTILHLLHLPTITHFMVSSMRNFVVSDLIPCVNLKSFQLNELSVGSLRVTALRLLTQFANGKSVIDFSSLSKITVGFDKPDDGPAAQKLFAHCKMLKDVDFSCEKGIPILVSVADMLRPSMRTLRKLAVSFIVGSEDDDPLFGLASELEAMRAENIIESITIHISVEMDEDCSCGDEWGRLDTSVYRFSPKTGQRLGLDRTRTDQDRKN